MRLIDADALIKAVQQHMVKINSLFEEEKTVVEIIDAQPTAYDIEQVVAEVQNVRLPLASQKARIIGIIRKGGME